MATAPINRERLKELLDYEPETGLLRWRVNRRGRFARIGAIAGHPTVRGYVHVRVDQVLCSAHRLAWLHANGTWPDEHIDHIDGDTSNNRLTNLRLVSDSGNNQNRHRPPRNSRTGVMGVTLNRHGSRFLAHIKTNGVRTKLGSFLTAEEANAAYVEAKRRLHPMNTL